MMLKKKTILHDPKAPHRNKALNNLKHEQWKEIPDQEGCYLISSYRRVKSLPRCIEVYLPKQLRSIIYFTKQRILRIKVHEKWNTIITEPYYECTISIHFRGIETNYLVSRLVYHAFVKEIDFETDALMIMHKDRDSLNNHYNNLVAGRRSEVTQRAIMQKDILVPSQ